MPFRYHTTMLKFLLAFALSLSALLCAGQSRLALLIGIGDYPAESGWNRIHGDNDIPIIKEMLLRQGFGEGDISVLLNSSATKANILAEFDALCLRAGKGDAIYIHFSGHGQQVTDLDGDEDDGFDEAWIPYDARKSYESGVYEGENHILDDEINELLSRLRARVGERGKIVVVADACHSGSGSRGLLNEDEDVFVRGTADKFLLPGGKQMRPRRQSPVKWLFIAACKPYQTNYEYRTEDGSYYGALSYVIAADSDDLTSGNFSDIFDGWKNKMARIVRYPQNPDRDGRPGGRNEKMF